ncbi:MAG: hypothetical protein MPEBLZ_03197, partial [Candidatus Methanoperedens nitroreducens]
MVETRFLELVNATLGLSILLITFVLLRDFRRQLQSRDNKFRIPLILLSTGIMVFSVREFIKYGLTQGRETVLDELLETLYLLLTLGAFFYLLRIKELPSDKIIPK